ncbi:MAG TPA: heavy-metal-associated domain-containing protein [Firmicutes bacterium]|nr:heavy-metal-associated domain-containing protein [Bacillota bacterium]HHY97710.1 heavy-metal-associated domain-containing protein [Bacillota bacterium]
MALFARKKSAEGKAESLTLTVNGMKCEGCIERVVKGLKSLDGVQDASGELSQKKISVSYDPAVLKRDDIVNTIENLGYRVQK